MKYSFRFILECEEDIEKKVRELLVDKEENPTNRFINCIKMISICLVNNLNIEIPHDQIKVHWMIGTCEDETAPIIPKITAATTDYPTIDIAPDLVEDLGCTAIADFSPEKLEAYSKDRYAIVNNYSKSEINNDS